MVITMADMTKCARCPSWIVSNIKCKHCGTVQPYKHRESIDAALSAEKHSRKCVFCSFSSFDTL